MSMLLVVSQVASEGFATLIRRLHGQDRDRGDVPGWVLITLMTAGLVTVLWALASSTLQEVFTNAVDAVVDSGGE